MTKAAYRRYRRQQRAITIIAGTALLALVGFIWYRTNIQGRDGAPPRGLFPGENDYGVGFALLASLAGAGILLLLSPGLGRRNWPAQRQWQRRGTQLPWWIGWPLLIVVFAAGAALFWTFMYD